MSSTCTPDRTFVPPARRASAPDASVWPLGMPADHVGPVALPGTGRMVWWTGRVAIGLRHDAAAPVAPSRSAQWIQSLLLGAP
jgi:hypothetical protein